MLNSHYRFRKRAFAPTIIVLLFFIVLLGCAENQNNVLTIAAAANMQFAMEELELAFESESGTDVEIIFSSSGKLTSQIIAGAPYDLFLSADAKYPQRLLEEGLTDQNPQTYAYGNLVIWSALDSTKILNNEIDWTSTQIAVANPKTAPYGQAAMEFIDSEPSYRLFKDKLVFGESISQVNQFLLSGAAQIGFTSKSSVLSEPFAGKGMWNDLPKDSYTPIDQHMVILNNRPEMQNQAQAFFDFILSARGQEILNNFGYSSAKN